MSALSTTASPMGNRSISPPATTIVHCVVHIYRVYGNGERIPLLDQGSTAQHRLRFPPYISHLSLARVVQAPHHQLDVPLPRPLPLQPRPPLNCPAARLCQVGAEAHVMDALAHDGRAHLGVHTRVRRREEEAGQGGVLRVDFNAC